MPFITEEIWQLIGERKDGESLMVSKMPKIRKYDKELVNGFEVAKETITAIRSVRKEKKILNRDAVGLCLRADRNSYDTTFLPVVVKLCNLSEVSFVSEKPENAASFMVKTTEFHIPLGGRIDVENERAKIIADLNYFRGFLNTVMKKLDNERFVQNAPPQILDLERKKKADTESKIKSLEEALKGLSGKK
jgi:valyl-tRNA synthetase